MTAGPTPLPPVLPEQPTSSHEEARENRSADREDVPELHPRTTAGTADQTSWDIHLDVDMDPPVEAAGDTGPAEVGYPQLPLPSNDQPATPCTRPDTEFSEPAATELDNTAGPDEINEEATKDGGQSSIGAPRLSQGSDQPQQTPPAELGDSSLRTTPPPVGAGRPTRQCKLPVRFDDYNLFGIRPDNCWPAISNNRNDD